MTKKVDVLKADIEAATGNEKGKARRNALAIMAIMFGTVSIWKGFSGLIDYVIISQSAALGALVYFICIVLGLMILGLVHYHLRDLVK